MLEDNTPTVTARRRKPTELLRLRLETARRLQNLNARSRAKRRAAKKSTPENIPPDAEHNVNIAPRVPKIKKNKLSHPATPQSKFKKRQRGKTWLPTHMFHAKRAHMSDPKTPLWQFAIPLTPTEKCYRPTHRASGARGAIAWDMSYISTIGLDGTGSSLEGLLRALGINGQDAWGNKGKKWRAGTRSLQAWAFERDGGRQPISPVTIIWCSVEKPEDVEMTDADSKPNQAEKKKKKEPKRRMFIRVHPSAFLQLWQEVLKVAKIQKPQVLVEDLRFEIGSIEITGPSATETLLSALKPVSSNESDNFSEGSPEHTWQSLTGLTNIAAAPQNALLSFNISDPRLRYPPRKTDVPSSEEAYNSLTETLARWPPDTTAPPASLFSRPARLNASRLLSSQKSINRRRSQASPGEYPTSKPTDPEIPTIILASKSNNLSKTANTQGTWTVLLPWKCVTPVWYHIIYHPLSSGGNPRFGGVQEQQQLSFESNKPWFPGDYPGTKAGWAWQASQVEKEKNQWERRPKGKRVEFDSVNLGEGKKGEVGRGWACDWEHLVSIPPPSSMDNTTLLTLNNVESSKDKMPEDGAAKLKDADASGSPPLNIHQLEPSIASSIITQKSKAAPLSPSMQSELNNPALATVSITLLGRGTPSPQSRVYRLPTNNPTLRSSWLAVLDEGTPSKEKRKKSKPSTSFSALVNGESDTPQHLPIPPEEDLIGFVTTGSFNLATGKGTGIGAILVNRLEPYVPPSGVGIPEIETAEKRLGKAKLMRTCIVRTSGESVGRLGWWEVA